MAAERVLSNPNICVSGIYTANIAKEIFKETGKYNEGFSFVIDEFNETQRNYMLDAYCITYNIYNNRLITDINIVSRNQHIKKCYKARRRIYIDLGIIDWTPTKTDAIDIINKHLKLAALIGPKVAERYEYLQKLTIWQRIKLFFKGK